MENVKKRYFLFISIISNILRIFLFIFVFWIIYFLIYGNFHQVDKDLYRSAQLYSFNLSYYIRKYHIRSILNLRGGRGKWFYKDEIDTSKEYNITHYDYYISDISIQSIKSMNKIIRILKKAPKPILIHCKAGADRTSLVSALYLDSIKKDKNASKELSILYGHFPWLGSKTKAMDKSFANYVKFYP